MLSLHQVVAGHHADVAIQELENTQGYWQL
jgi:hypothetical protein